MGVGCGGRRGGGATGGNGFASGESSFRFPVVEMC